MNKTKEEIIEDYKIKYRKHAFSKSIKISIKDENSILVTMPFYCPYKKARDFLIQNIEKIKSYHFKRNNYAKDFKTKFDTLKIIPCDSSEIKIETRKNIVYFYYQKDKDFNSNEIQKKLKEAHLLALKLEAKYYLPNRLSYIARKYGYSYNKLALRNQKTRFGSCSYQNNINLNINLMMYDFDIIDYVLIHELAHTKVKNHSKTFWEEVEKNCPNYKQLRKELKTSNNF